MYPGGVVPGRPFFRGGGAGAQICCSIYASICAASSKAMFIWSHKGHRGSIRFFTSTSSSKLKMRGSSCRCAMEPKRWIGCGREGIVQWHRRRIWIRERGRTSTFYSPPRVPLRWKLRSRLTASAQMTRFPMRNVAAACSHTSRLLTRLLTVCSHASQELMPRGGHPTDRHENPRERTWH